MNKSGFLSTTELADELGLRPWTLRRLFMAGVLAEPGRVGGHRVVHSDEVPVIRAALAAVGIVTEKAAKNV